MPKETKEQMLEKVLSKRRTVPPREIIFLEGQSGNEAYVVLLGEAQVVVEDDLGNSKVISRLGPGEMFGELALLQDNNRRNATVTSEQGCELLVIEQKVFTERLEDADPFLRFVIDHLISHILAWSDRERKH